VTDDAPVPGRRRAWLAALLDLFAFPLGHVYAGRARRGFVLWLGATAAMVVVLWAGMASGVPALGMLAFAVLLLLRLALVADGFVAARRAAGEPLKPYQRPAVYVALGIVLLLCGDGITGWIRGNVARAYRIPSGSMQPTLLQGDYLMTVPDVADPLRRGAVVVYHREVDGVTAITRVMGLPGDTLEMRAKTLYLNGRPLREPYTRHIDTTTDPRDDLMAWQAKYLAPPPRGPYRPSRDNWGPLVVPAGELFMLGDDRDNSYDSRHLGFTAPRALKGRPTWIYLSRGPAGVRWSRIGRTIQ
jgi:signal peptidase I